MKSLFMVRTAAYKTYYVFANGYDEAVQKVRDYKGITPAQLISPYDGSLNMMPQDDEIKYVELLSDEVIM